MTSPRDILFLAQRIPYPPDRGDRITTWHILRRFLEQGHRVRIGCFLESDHDLSSVQELTARSCEVVAERLRPAARKLLALPWLLTSRPLTWPYFMHGRLRRRLRASIEARGPDVCYAYSSSMGFYMLAFGGLLADCRRVAHFAELDSDKWAQYAATSGFPGRWVYGREARRLLAWETRLAHHAHANVVCSPIEKQLFEQRIPDTSVVVLPNGVDLDAFHPGDPRARKPETAVFTGVMSYAPNVDAVTHFAATSWPEIRARHPSAKLFVVGSSPSPAVEALDGRDGIVVTGRVDSTVPWLQRAAVGIAPLRMARGIQNKVLEAMACGLPAVVSPKAFTGIDAVPGQHLIVAAGERATTDAVLSLFADKDRAESLGRAARARVEERYRWDRILDGLDEIVGRASS